MLALVVWPVIACTETYWQTRRITTREDFNYVALIHAGLRYLSVVCATLQTRVDKSPARRRGGDIVL